jgi:hypothetical protein
MRLRRDKPQGIVREPGAQGGTADLRYGGPFPETRTTVA